MHTSPANHSRSPRRAHPRVSHSPRGSVRVRSPQRGQRGGEPRPPSSAHLLETLRRLQEDVRKGTGHAKEYKLAMVRLKALFRKVHDVLHPHESLTPHHSTVKLSTKAIREIRSRIGSLCRSIHNLMASYGLLDEATTGQDERFVRVCQMLLEQMVSYVILRNVSTVAEIQEREARTAMASLLKGLMPLVSNLFDLSNVHTFEGVEFTVEDLCNGLRHESLLGDGHSHYWRRSSPQKGGDASDYLILLSYFAANWFLWSGHMILFILSCIVLFTGLRFNNKW
jgi:hypothetical protein